MSSHLLRRHIIYCPHDHTWRRIQRLNSFDAASGRRFFQFGQAEVENLYAPVACHKDVFGLEIAVDDAFGVSCSKAIGDLLGISQRSALSNRTLLELLAQFFA